MELKDDKLKDLMKISKVELPFADFEEKMMRRIEKVEQEKRVIDKSRKYALLFFLLGTLFGMAANYLLTYFIIANELLSESLKNNVTLFSQLMYVVLIVLFSDKMLRLMRLTK